MRGRKIWWRRLKQDWLYQFNIIRTVFDWTIIVYLLIPFLAFLGITYYSWWNSLPDWLEGVPYEALFLSCFLLCWQGTIRTFMEEADQLTLLQFSKIMTEIRYIGVIYSWILLLLKWLLLFVWLYPLLNHYDDLTFYQLLVTSLFFFSLNLLLTTYKQVVYKFEFWKKLIIELVVTCFILILCFAIIFKPIHPLIIGIALIFFCLSLWQVKGYQSQIKTFYDDVEKEQRNKVKYIKFMFTVNPEVTMPQVKKQKKRSRILWRNSARIFQKRSPENGVTELFMKSFLRDKGNLLQYFQVISITSAIIFTTPIWIKWLVTIVFYFFFREWIVLMFKEIVKQNPYLSADYGEKEYMFIAQKKCENRFVYPGVCLVILIASLSTVIAILL
ncbi:ABC transporter permease [Metabacillus litoralis]|uniref:ABC transporter permease n=1 Tax=Metabacillus litoralis TaxID=152268 RepID=UPI000EF603A1|nr:ABC transporter permease [Metabacillus litoralis]